MEALKLAHQIVEAIEDKKGENILLLDISKQSIFTDYFVIATGSSDRQLRALAEGVSALADKQIKRHVMLKQVDEQAASGWVLIDLGDVVVHLFSADQRKHYDLEGLWTEGRVLLRVQ